MKKWLLAVSGWALLSFQSANAQQFLWGRTPGGIGNDVATGLVADASGNVYVCGNIAGSAEFNGTVYQHYELYESFLAKYDAQGNIQWVKLAGGHGVDKATAICIDGDGHLIMTGYFEDTAWFESTAVVAAGEKDVFVAKYNSSGSLLWVKSCGGIQTDLPSAITVDDNNNVYITGNYEQAMNVGAQLISTSNLFTETFVVALDASGNFSWAKTAVGTSANQGTGIVFNHQGKLGITGFFGGSLDAQGTIVSSNGPSYDIYVWQMDVAGNTDWCVRAGGTYEDAGSAIGAFSNGDYAVAGYFAGTAGFGTHSLTYFDYNDVFVARISAAGEFQWVQKCGGYQLDYPGGVAVDAGNRVYITGFYEENGQFGNNWVAATDRDCFIASYDDAGNFRWVDHGGGVYADVGMAVLPVSEDELYICGYYLHTCAFGDVTLDYADNNDAFVVKYNPPTVSSVGLYEIESGLYPVPTSKRLHMPVGRFLFVTDLAGEKCSASAEGQTVDVSGLSKGYYLLHFQATAGEVQVVRFLVE